MKDFLFIYRADYAAMQQQGSPEQMQAMMQRWMDWLGTLTAKDQLKDKGNRLQHGGKVVKPNNVVTDGPYMEIKETLGGYSIIVAPDIDAATEIAKTCPIYMTGGSVEVREIAAM